MPSKTSETFAPFDVVVVPFPYSDRLAEKRRPAVVVSSSAVHRAGYVWLAMVTTVRDPALPGDEPIETFEAAGLPRDCIVRPLKIACIEPARVLRRLGRLDAATARRLATTLAGFVAKGR